VFGVDHLQHVCCNLDIVPVGVIVSSKEGEGDARKKNFVWSFLISSYDLAEMREVATHARL
jgi:hypothetical protein